MRNCFHGLCFCPRARSGNATGKSHLEKENALTTLKLNLQALKACYFDEVLYSSGTYTGHADRQGAGLERQGTESQIEGSRYPVPPGRYLAAHHTLSEGRICTNPYAQLAEPQWGDRHGHAYGVDREGLLVHPQPLRPPSPVSNGKHSSREKHLYTQPEPLMNR